MTFSGSYYAPKLVGKNHHCLYLCVLYTYTPTQLNGKNQTKGPSLKIEMLLGLFSIFLKCICPAKIYISSICALHQPGFKKSLGSFRSPPAVPNRSDVFSSFLRIFRGKIQQLSTCGPLTSFRCLVLGGVLNGTR